jgi:hypothetical protein
MDVETKWQVLLWLLVPKACKLQPSTRNLWIRCSRSNLDTLSIREQFWNPEPLGFLCITFFQNLITIFVSFFFNKNPMFSVLSQLLVNLKADTRCRDLSPSMYNFFPGSEVFSFFVFFNKNLPLLLVVRLVVYLRTDIGCCGLSLSTCSFFLESEVFCFFVFLASSHSKINILRLNKKSRSAQPSCLRKNELEETISLLMKYIVL